MVAPADRAIDLAHVADYQHAGRVRWAEVAADGITDAMLRACYRTSVDASYAAHVAAARAVGIRTGAYAFLRPGDIDRQIATFLAVVRPGPGDVCYADFEDYKRPGDAVATMGTADEAQEWREAVEATGARVILYSRRNILDGKLADKTLRVPADHPLRTCPLWASGYPTVDGGQARRWDERLRGHLELPKPWHGPIPWWQYTAQGRVRGIDGPVDRSYGAPP